MDSPIRLQFSAAILATILDSISLMPETTGILWIRCAGFALPLSSIITDILAAKVSRVNHGEDHNVKVGLFLD